MQQTHDDLHEAARIIRQLIDNTFNGEDDLTGLNDHQTTISILIAARQAGESRFWSTLGPILDFEPDLRHAVFHADNHAGRGTTTERKRWHYEDTLKDIPRPKPLLEYHGVYLPDKGLSLLYGESGKGKSFVAVDWALTLAKTRPVIYIAAERFPLYRDRINAWYRHHGIRSQNHLILYEGALDILDPHALKQWIDEAKTLGQPPCAVFIDTVACCLLGDENSGDTMGRFIAGWRLIQKKLDCAVIGVHHTGKEVSKGARGHYSLTCAADAVVELRRQQDQTLVLTNTKQSGTVEFDPVRLCLLTVELGSDPETGEPISNAVLVPVASPAPKVPKIKLSASQRKILDMLAISGDGHVQRDIVSQSGLGKSTVSETLPSLVERGYVTHLSSHLSLYQITLAGKELLETLGDAEAEAA